MSNLIKLNKVAVNNRNYKDKSVESDSSLDDHDINDHDTIPIKQPVKKDDEDINDDYLTDINTDPKRESPFKYTECVLYFVFVGLFGITAILSRSADSSLYRVTSQLKTTLFQENIMDHGPTYHDMVQESEMWDYIETLLLPRLLTETLPSGNNQSIAEEKNKYLVNTNNKLMGGIRLRTQRVEPETCLVEDNLFPDCRDEDAQSTQLLIGFSTALFPNNGSIEFTTDEQNDDDLLPWIGEQRQYEGSGYVVDLPLNLPLALRKVRDLRENGFVNRLTSVVLIDFNTYNALVNLHTVSRLAIEFTESGGALSSYDIKTWKLYRYKGNTGDLIMLLESILVLFVCWFTFEEVRDFIQSPRYVEFKDEESKEYKQFAGMKLKVIGKNKDAKQWKVQCDDEEQTTDWIRMDQVVKKPTVCKVPIGCSCSMYFYEKWNIVDFINIILFDATIALRLYMILTDTPSKYSDTTNFRSYRNIDNMLKIEMAIQMFNGFILVIKLMKYMTFSARIQFLFDILSHSAQDLAIFAIVLFVLFGAFGFSGFILFSSDVQSFRTFPHSFLNLFRFLIGDVDYDELAESSTIYGSIYYCSFGVVMLLILSNVFIAILCDAYVEVKKKGAEENDMSIFNVLSTPFQKLQKMFNGDDKNAEITVDELAQGANISKMAARQFIKEYDNNNDGKLSRKEFEKLKKQKKELKEKLEAITTDLKKKQKEKLKKMQTLLGIDNEDKIEDNQKYLYNFMVNIKAEIKSEMKEIKAMIKKNNGNDGDNDDEQNQKSET